MSIFRWIAISAVATTATALAQPAGNQLELGAEFRGPYGFSSPLMRDARQYDRQAPLGYPAAETREVLFSRARSVIAKYEKERARQRVNEQVDRLRRQFNKSAEFVAAKEAEEAAWEEYRSAVASVVSNLMSDPNYTANAALALEISTQIRDLRLDLNPAGQGSVHPDVLDLARTKLSYAQQISSMRAAALESDPAVVQARMKLTTAAERTRRLRDDFKESILDNESVIALRENFETARINSIAAAAYESLARKLSRGAVWYSWNLLYSGRAFYDHGYFENYSWPIVTTLDAPAAPPMEPIGQNGYGFQRR